MSQATALISPDDLLGKCNLIIDTIIEINNLEIDGGELDTLVRLEETYKIVKSRLRVTDPYLLPENVIHNIAQNTDKIISEIQQLVEDNDYEIKLINLNECIDNVLIQTSNIIQPQTHEEIEALRNSIVSARSSLAQHNRYIREDYEKFLEKRKKIDDEFTEVEDDLALSKENIEKSEENILNSLSELKNKLNSEVSGKNEEIDALYLEIQQNLEGKLEDYTGKIEAFTETVLEKRDNLTEQFTELKHRMDNELEGISSRADDLMSNFKGKYTEEQENRNEEFRSQQEKSQGEFNEQLKLMEQEIKQKKSLLDDKYDKHIDELDSRVERFAKDVHKSKDELYKLIEVAGNDVMSDGYAKYANKALISKITWQVISLICLLGLVFATYSIIPSLEKGNFYWTILIARTLLTFSVGGLAAFTIRQAQVAHIEEQHNRDMQLKLGSIEPYLKNFEQEKRNEIKEMLVIDYFSNKNNPSKSDKKEDEVKVLEKGA